MGENATLHKTWHWDYEALWSLLINVGKKLKHRQTLFLAPAFSCSSFLILPSIRTKDRAAIFFSFCIGSVAIQHWMNHQFCWFCGKRMRIHLKLCQFRTKISAISHYGFSHFEIDFSGTPKSYGRISFIWWERNPDL